MGRQIEWSEIPDATLLPQDLYEFEVEDLTEETSKKGKLMYKATFRVTQGTFNGTPLFDYFNIGTDDDPKADEEATWKNSIGVRRLKRLFKATQIPMTPDVDEMVETVKQQRFVGAVTQEVDDGTRDPKYAGVKRNRIDAMYPVGTRQPGTAAVVDAAPAPKLVPRPGAAKPAPAAKAKAAPTVPCPYCGDAVARTEYVKHVTELHPNEG